MVAGLLSRGISPFVESGLIDRADVATAVGSPARLRTLRNAGMAAGALPAAQPHKCQRLARHHVPDAHSGITTARTTGLIPLRFLYTDRVTVLPIRLFGDPVLRTPADPVTVFDKELRQLVADLTETMLDAPGAGLAAPQLGVGLRVFAYHVSEDEQGHLINPVLHFPSDETQDGPEGCLSIPGLFWDCVRLEHVVAHGQNMYGDPVTVEGTATLARCLQHETDHLDGVLFVERLDAQTRKIALREIRNAEWSGLVAPVIKMSPHDGAVLGPGVFGQRA
jgi:peptide deformylase